MHRSHLRGLQKLNLNTQKCEVVVFASNPHAPYPQCKIAEQAISVGSEGKLGYWWQKKNLMANMALWRRASRKPEEAFFIMVQLMSFKVTDR